MPEDSPNRTAAPLQRGRLSATTSAPQTGETTKTLWATEQVAVEEILSGTTARPVEYLQEQDEWVVLLEGGGELEVAGESVPMTRGDWLFLPSGTPHRLLHTEPGSHWLAVHARPIPTTGERGPLLG